MLLKCYTQYASKVGKLSRGHRTGKDYFSFQYQLKGNANDWPKTADLLTNTLIWLSLHCTYSQLLYVITPNILLYFFFEAGY